MKKYFRTGCKAGALALLTLLTLPQSVLAAEKPTSVIVVGAGLSGLNGALLLEEQGYQVTVLEASDRIGGRLYTLDEVPGTPEAGGNVIGPSYARILDRASEFNVPLEPAPKIAGGAMNYYIDGEFIKPGDWAAAPQNPFPERLKKVPPGGALFSVLRPNPLSTPDDWRGEDSARYDVSVQALLEQMGFDERGRNLAGHANSYGNSLADTSLLALYRIGAVYAMGRALPGQPMAVTGGNQRLPEAMAKGVEGEILTGKWVTVIRQGDGGVSVTTRDGSQYHADFALVTVPVPALRHITIEPALPALQQRAVNELDYAKTFLAFFTVTGEYWGDQTPSLWTDTPAERLFATADDSGEVSNITMWTTGEQALAFSALAGETQSNALYDALYAIYPQAKGKVELQAVRDWNSDALAGGSWLRWQPGQITEFAAVLAEPAGRLFFAGEHTAITNTGMEGAMESAERAVGEIMAMNQPAAETAVDGEKLFVYCQGCHSTEAGEAHKLGPNLNGFYGQPRATREGYAYSAALADAGGAWDRNSLREWLLDPQKAVPGNRMIYTNMYSAEELEALLAFLTELK